MKVLLASLLLLLPLMLMALASSSPSPGVARGHRDQRQASRRWPQDPGQECECKDWLPRAPKRKLATVSTLPKKQCPCDHPKVNVKRIRHQKHYRKPHKRSRACHQFLKRCHLESIALLF
ncbi:C-X-C motif chemokine 17 [Ctenodactylus gundi]